jgi:hypothetical protein
MDETSEHGRSQLFLVRLWEKREVDVQPDENTNEGRQTWCGTVQHTVSGKSATFRGWDGLNAALSEMLQALIGGKRR